MIFNVLFRQRERESERERERERERGGGGRGRRRNSVTTALEDSTGQKTKWNEQLTVERSDRTLIFIALLTRLVRWHFSRDFAESRSALAHFAHVNNSARAVSFRNMHHRVKISREPWANRLNAKLRSPCIMHRIANRSLNVETRRFRDRCNFCLGRREIPRIRSISYFTSRELTVFQFSFVVS